jgi:2-aminobenzoate-CoA ligase
VLAIGATEMLHIFIASPEDEIRPGATGRPVPGYEARVLADQAEHRPVGGGRGEQHRRAVARDRRREVGRASW